jgi:hypothetical protein
LGVVLGGYLVNRGATAEEPKVAGTATPELAPEKECLEAIGLAKDLLATLKLKPSDYKLIVMKNLVVRGNEYKGPQYWDITFKSRSVIPDKADECVGAGGEIFIDVDLSARKATLRGYGE